jgi:hypothetical protein
MKLYNITALLFLLPFAAISQSPGMDAALNKGSAADLGVFFAESVDVSILNTDATMSSDKAVETLTNFFSQNMVKGYNRAHLATPQNGRAAYSLGDLYTATGTYRVYLYFDAGKKISEIRIQK